MSRKQYLQRVQRNDRLARRCIIGGGIGIIAIVLGMLFLITATCFPLFFPSKLSSVGTVSLPADVKAESVLALGVNDYSEGGYLIDAEGVIRFFALPGGGEIDRHEVTASSGSPASLVSVRMVGPHTYAYLWQGGEAALIRIGYSPEFAADGVRTIAHRVKELHRWEKEIAGEAKASWLVKQGETSLRVDQLAAGGFAVQLEAVEEDFLGNRTVTAASGSILEDEAGSITDFCVDKEGGRLYAGTEAGYLLQWDISNPENIQRLDAEKAWADGRAITSVGLVFGDISIAVADGAGTLDTWMPVRRYVGTSGDADSRKQLTRIHSLRSHDSGVVNIVPSQRSKSLFSLSADGVLHADHMTSERALAEAGKELPVVAFAVANRETGILTLHEGGMQLWELKNPHPETSVKTLFGKVWYENYDEPAYVWQSSSADSDFEPKLSLMPLIMGTLKGTLYAMLFAVPIAVLAALYASQFMSPRLRGVIKPSVEIMAAVPSVVVGFLAGLWLAPLLEHAIPGIMCTLFMLPLCLMVSVLGYRQVRHLPVWERIENGLEFLVLIPVVLLSVYAAVKLGGVFENAVFAGDFKQWLYDSFQLRVDQRNSIVIAFALGFTVIPIIFTLSDDALAAVPRNLTAASLALGASRWQTAWRVVLPSASPGIFAAIMIGLGRAVGETMIVLMATGNTPIMEWSIFNGMRTLAANIAVEIPEAPHHGTLYRTLFLSAVLLFLLTFIVNTVAEIVRQRLRKKYGNY